MKNRFTLAALALVLVICSVAAFADFATNGGWHLMYLDRRVVTAPVDTVTRTDTIEIAGGDSITIEIDSTLSSWGSPPAQWAKITFLYSDNDSNTDSTAFMNHCSDSADAADTLVLTANLTAWAKSGDTIQIEWYSDNVGVDTVTSPTMSDEPIFTANSFLARLTHLSSTDSTGVQYVVQTRVGDNGTWTTVATLGLMATGVDSIVALTDTLTAANIFLGNQYRVLSVFSDSVGGTVRTTTINGEVWWRGLGK